MGGSANAQQVGLVNNPLTSSEFIYEQSTICLQQPFHKIVANWELTEVYYEYMPAQGCLTLWTFHDQLQVVAWFQGVVWPWLNMT